MTLAALLKTRRERAGLSLRALAHESGVSNPLISQIENGLVLNPGIQTVKKLAKILRISPLAIFSACE